MRAAPRSGSLVEYHKDRGSLKRDLNGQLNVYLASCTGTGATGGGAAKGGVPAGRVAEDLGGIERETDHVCLEYRSDRRRSGEEAQNQALLLVSVRYEKRRVR